MTVCRLSGIHPRMPYNSNVRPQKIGVRSHKNGRYISDPRGILRGIEGDLVDMHAFLTNHSVSVQVLEVTSREMRASGLFPKNYALVDRALPVRDGSIVAVLYEGITVVRRLVKREGAWFLVADDPREQDYPITDETNVERLGVVTHSIIVL